MRWASAQLYMCMGGCLAFAGMATRERGAKRRDRERLVANRTLLAGLASVAGPLTGLAQIVGAPLAVRIVLGAVTVAAAAGALWFLLLERRVAARGVDSTLEQRVVPRADLNQPMKFSNRTKELAQLDRLLERLERGEGPQVAVLGGLPGVGKSAVGRHWASLVRERFSDGDLVADFSQRRRGGAVDVSGFLAEFIRRLGPPGTVVPPTFTERVERFQAMTFGRKLLILLDDVSKASEVSMLRPTGKESLVLATSYQEMEGLHSDGAEFVPVDPLSPDRAEGLLVEMAGELGAAFRESPEETKALVGYCGGLALPLCVCASRLLLGRGALTVEAILAEVADEQRRLDYLAGKGEYAGAAVFGFAYADLLPSQRLVYRRIGLHPGVDLAPVHAALLTGSPLADAQVAMAALADTNLLNRLENGRYRFHDLVRLHARESAAREDAEAELENSVKTLVDWYRACLRRADWALIFERLRLAPPDPIAADHLPDFPDRESAFDWLEEERPNLLPVLESARDREWDEWVWQMVESLWLFYYNRRHYLDWIEVTEIGIECAHRAGHRDAEARLLTQLAWALCELRRFESAHTHLEEANRLVRESENLQLQGSVREFTGSYHLKKGEYDRAIAAFEEARNVATQVKSNRGVALQDYFIGWALIEKGEYAKAQKPLADSLERMRVAEDGMFEGRLLLRLGQALRGSGSHEEAERTLNEGLDLLIGLELRIEQAEAYDELAALADEQGDGEKAEERRGLAQDIYRRLGHPRAGEGTLATASAADPA